MNTFDINSHELQIVEHKGQLYIHTFSNGKFIATFKETEFETLLRDIISHSTKTTMETSELLINLKGNTTNDSFSMVVPIVAATWDMTSKDDIDRYLNINCGEAVERVLDCTPAVQVDLMIERNKHYLINYIRHELAGRYVLSKFGAYKSEELENKIKNMSIMQGYNLDLFSKSTDTHYRYTTPQIVKTNFKDNGNLMIKYNYMGLQKNVPAKDRDEAFYREVQANDIAYQTVGASLNLIAEDMLKWYNVKFTPKIISSLVVNLGKDPDQPGGPQ